MCTSYGIHCILRPSCFISQEPLHHVANGIPGYLGQNHSTLLLRYTMFFTRRNHSTVAKDTPFLKKEPLHTVTKSTLPPPMFLMKEPLHIFAKNTHPHSPRFSRKNHSTQTVAKNNPLSQKPATSLLLRIPLLSQKEPLHTVLPWIPTVSQERSTLRCC